ncbi:DUF6163 family protein [Martelella endophytica]|uniref:Integral membrane protein n=1 Tax=Martelella endophytica TaxID=1486262 RepID=A0A0D5LV84_MAREN|nr:DUF6163 family protein [Martelella endophytica]AJY47677.1 hypothetical protein TM49_21585 [Martelella endophytica]
MTVRPGFSQTAFVVFKRVVAVYLVVLALSSWSGLIGLTMDGAGRFDVVNANVRFVELALAVLYPVAATGLWFGVGWGFVLWALGAAVEIGAHGGYPQLFGAAPTRVGLHILFIGIYAAFWVYLVFIRRR